ncbi:hypothetical protein CDAR_435911 [Caerostris darwini]|uniref:Uncharacterized protein n=1 Tax=Caerostris darwini TaxID=1538125 RepID=A0AAV4SKD3_9ARAC|nr:hypothetical protein CDAR_435911 [Caerostris darwini]
MSWGHTRGERKKEVFEKSVRAPLAVWFDLRFWQKWLPRAGNFLKESSFRSRWTGAHLLLSPSLSPLHFRWQVTSRRKHPPPTTPTFWCLLGVNFTFQETVLSFFFPSLPPVLFSSRRKEGELYE